MPLGFWLLLSGAHFALGLVGLARWSSPIRQALSLALLFQAALLLLIAATANRLSLDGQVAALLAAGVLPIVCGGGIMARHLPQGKR